MLPRVLEMVATMREPFVLVLDDVHRLGGSTGTEVLPALVDRIPAGSALAFVTRGRVPFAASRAPSAGALSASPLRTWR